MLRRALQWSFLPTVRFALLALYPQSPSCFFYVVPLSVSCFVCNDLFPPCRFSKSFLLVPLSVFCFVCTDLFPHVLAILGLSGRQFHATVRASVNFAVKLRTPSGAESFEKCEFNGAGTITYSSGSFRVLPVSRSCFFLCLTDSSPSS